MAIGLNYKYEIETGDKYQKKKKKMRGWVKCLELNGGITIEGKVIKPERRKLDLQRCERKNFRRVEER